MNTSEVIETSFQTPLSLIDEMVTQLCPAVPRKKKNQDSPKRSGKRSKCRKATTYPLSQSAIEFDRFAPKFVTIDFSSRVFKIYTELSTEHAIALLKFARAVLEVLYDFSEKIITFDHRSQFSMLNGIRSWSSADFVKNAKYFCCYPMAKFSHNPLPKVPPGYYTPQVKRALIFSGPVLRFLKHRLFCFNRKNLFLWNSFLQGVKRGCHVVSEEFVENSVRDHAKALTTPPPHESFSEDVIKPYLEELFKDLPSLDWNQKYVEASPSASFEQNRGSGGGYMVVQNLVSDNFRRIFIMGDRKHAVSVCRHDEPSLLSMGYHPHFGVYEIRGGYFDRYGLRSLLAKEYLCASYTQSHVHVHPIEEPLKCRIITKAPALLSFVCHPLQRLLWDHLFSLAPFRLLGAPVSSRIVDSLGLKANEFMVSGDYSAATDGINLFMTKKVMEFILEKTKLPPELSACARHVLYEQELFYKNKYDVPGEHFESADGKGFSRVNQQNGQLMGSILSFPVLCIINLLGYWMSLDYTNSSHTPLSDLRVLINGDDILFPCDDTLYGNWLSMIEGLGFTLSLGKNYCHSRFCTVNSQCFWKTPSGFEPVGFLNTGLLTGQSKHTGRNQVKNLPTCDYYNEVVHTSHNPVRTHRRFLHYFKNEISEITSDGELNLFAPIEAGGLGFQLPSGINNYYTPFQKKWASYSIACMSRRMNKERDPFRVCVVQEKGLKTILPSAPERKLFAWTQRQQMLLDTEKCRKMTPYLLRQPFVTDPETTGRAVVRLPPKAMKQSFRRLLPNLRGADMLSIPRLVRFNSHDSLSIPSMEFNQQFGRSISPGFLKLDSGWNIPPVESGWSPFPVSDDLSVDSDLLDDCLRIFSSWVIAPQ